MSYSSFDRIKDKLINDLGFIYPYLLQNDVIEVMVNPDGSVWVERLGQSMEHVGIIDKDKAIAIMDTIAASLGKTIKEDSPSLEGTLFLDGSRFAGHIPPVVASPTFAIRKKAISVFSLQQYVNNKILSVRHLNIIKKAIKDHKNFLVVGGTGSGKTTFLNALIQEMVNENPNERILIIEDTGEIQCNALNHVKLCSSPNVDMTSLLKSSLRMRPDRILIGEVRGPEALDLLDSWNTGHEGGAATIHANNVELALQRLNSLVSRNKSAPSDIDNLIGQVVHIIIHIAKTTGGRKVKQLLELQGYNNGKYIFNII